MALGGRGLAIRARQESRLRVAPIQEPGDHAGNRHAVLRTENQRHVGLPLAVTHCLSLLLIIHPIPRFVNCARGRAFKSGVLPSRRQKAT